MLLRAQEVEELICWHEDFDSREYTRNSQRHAATLEHGQREIRSIVGSVLLAQLRTNYHNHLAQVTRRQTSRRCLTPTADPRTRQAHRGHIEALTFLLYALLRDANCGQR